MAKKQPKRTPHEQELINLLGRRIRLSRHAAYLTHERLGEKSGISLRSMQAMQAGQMNIRFTTLARIMKALGLKSWDKLLPHWDDVEVKPPTKKAVKKAAKKATRKAAKKAATKTTKKAAKKAVKRKAAKKPPRKSAGGSKKK